ncbi:hypothetical protein ACFXK0_08050 [Nocardia sp. NPDC059177]|uniref:DUF7373 family lipoprotein n=1 Tax=Nocardia sp. NPDC059177 TaxID=3346759 RepID=UPI00369F9B26
MSSCRWSGTSEPTPRYRRPAVASPPICLGWEGFSFMWGIPRIRAACLAALIAGSVAGCGATVPGTAAPGEVDLSTLDTGSYPTEPLNAHDDPFVPPLFNMKTVAGLYLSDYTITAYDIDPRMKYQGSAGHLNSSLTVLFGKSDEMEEIVDRHGLLYGFATGGVSAKSSDTSQGKWPYHSDWPTKLRANELTANIAVARVWDDEHAKAAAQEFNDTDFANYRDHNERVSLPGHPTAHAHWQPGSPYMRAYLASGPYVIAIMVSAPTPDLAAIVDLAETAFTKQIEALAGTQPLTGEQAYTLPWDPDHLLARTLNPHQIPLPDSNGTHSVSGKQGFLHYIDRGLYEDREYTATNLDRMKAERVALSSGTVAFKVADPESARRAVTEKLFPMPFAGEAPAPAGVPDSACVENATPTAKNRYSCILAYRSYVAVVGSDQLLDVHQRAAAQYAIFANSR